MKILGFQKTTLLDFPEKIASLIFTGGCNFRCPFCHNSGIVLGTEPEIDEKDVFSYLEKRRGIVEGVCISGGEPLLHPDVSDLAERIKSLGLSVKIDTNGSRPDVLRSLVEKGLVDYVAMDIKNSPEKYSLTCGTEVDISSIRESASFLMENRVPFEFRTTLVGGLHTPQDFHAIGEWLRGDEKFFLQDFVDSGHVLEGGLLPCPDSVADEILSVLREYVPNAKRRNK